MSHFSKLLKESKVVGTIDTKLEQVYTSYNGYLKNERDFGLKRSLPKKTSQRTPWIKLKSIDTPYRQIDYRTASTETSLVKMWNQLEIGLKSARKNHAPPTHSSAEPKPIRIEFSSFDLPSKQLAFSNNRISNRSSSDSNSNSNSSTRLDEKGRIKPIWLMYQNEFDALLQLLRTKRNEFKSFLEDKEINNRKRNSLSSTELPKVNIDLYEYAQGNPDQIRRDIEEFLEQIKEETTIDQNNLDILPMPHPNLGLNYAHFDQLHNERLTPSIPGRILDQADIRSSRQTVSFAGIVGSLQRSGHIDLPSTTFEPDPTGYHNLEQGKAKFRVESAAIDPYDLPTGTEFQGFNNQQDQPVRWIDPRNKPRALNTNRLKVHLREAGQTDSNRFNHNNPIGSIDWVGSSPPKRQGTIVLDFLSSITRKFQNPSSSSSSSPSSNMNNNNSNYRASNNHPNHYQNNNSQQQPSSSNNNNRIPQSQNDQLMKVLKDLVGKPSK